MPPDVELIPLAIGDRLNDVRTPDPIAEIPRD